MNDPTTDRALRLGRSTVAAIANIVVDRTDKQAAKDVPVCLCDKEAPNPLRFHSSKADRAVPSPVSPQGHEETLRQLLRLTAFPILRSLEHFHETLLSKDQARSRATSRKCPLDSRQRKLP